MFNTEKITNFNFTVLIATLNGVLPGSSLLIISDRMQNIKTCSKCCGTLRKPQSFKSEKQIS
jgi:hypothetical protein